MKNGFGRNTWGRKGVDFTGRPGVDYILEFDGADRSNRGALDNLSFNQVVPAADVPAAILAAVPGFDQYSLIYEASIPELTPAWGAGATYTIDNSATGPASFALTNVLKGKPQHPSSLRID